MPIFRLSDSINDDKNLMMKKPINGLEARCSIRCRMDMDNTIHLCMDRFTFSVHIKRETFPSIQRVVKSMNDKGLDTCFYIIYLDK